MAEDMTKTVSVEVNADGDKNFDGDGFWKDLIIRFCYQLLKRAVPELYEKVDITKKPYPLDKEFTDVLNTGKRKLHKHPHFADLLIAIPMKDGTDEWILFHVEAQGPKGGNLPERMYHYKCLIYSHYRRNPVALAIVVGGHTKEERFYSYSYFGTKVIYEYNNLVLADLDDEELQASDNPIDLALYAAKCALRAKEELQKLNYLRSLLDLLGKRGWSRDDKRDLLLFLERIIDLQDEELEKQYVEHREKLMKEGKIVYIPLGERKLAKEIEQRAEERLIRNLLAEGVAPEVIARGAKVPVEQIQAIIN